MAVDLSQRVDRPELMDSETVPLPLMRQTLAFLSVTNKYFGGANVILRQLKKWSKNWKRDEPVTILDLGAGGGEIPMAIVDWARSEKRRVHITAVDIVPDVVSIARHNTSGYPEISIQERDFFDLVNERKKFDYVTASLFLHHISPAKTTTALQGIGHLAGRGIIISDLFRSHPSYWSVKAASLLIGNRIVRHDGPLSVQRAFTVDELNRLAEAANLLYLKAAREPWFRVSLAGEKPQ